MVRNWKDKNVEDLIDYYQINYAGMSRSEVRKADGGFYDAVRIRKLQEQVFPESRHRDWENKTVEDLIDYCNEHYTGLSRKEVKEIDSGFYEAVRKRELQDQVFPEGSQSHYRDWSKFEVENFQEYYQTNYAGMTRTEVKKADGSFYEIIRKRKLQDQVFPESQMKVSRGYWKDFDNIKKPLEELIDELGHFPSKSEIRNTNRSLSSAISNNHNGYISVKNQMGYLEREKELARILLEDILK